MIEPPVCVPIAPKHIPQATAAAEPLDEPPGVRSRFHGLRVTGGSIQAYGVVTVLPMMTAPASRRLATTSASDLGDPVGPALRRRRPSGSPGDVDDVLDADRNTMQRPAVVAGLQLVVERASLLERPLAIEHDPGVDLRLPLVDLGEAAR